MHVASLAGGWLALVCGFGGMRDHDGVLSLDPALPQAIRSLRFAVRWRGWQVHVAITRDHVTYTLEDDVDGRDGHIDLVHAGETFTLTTAEPVSRPLQERIPLTPTPQQPAGREPITSG